MKTVRTAVLLTVVTVTMLATALPAAANVGVSASLTFTATSVTVDSAGQRGQILVSNTNTPPQENVSNTLTQLRLALSCGAPGTAANLCPSPDPGVITTGTVATGSAGTACAGRTFTVSAPDASNIVSFAVVGAPIVLAPPGGAPGSNQCGVEFPIHFLKTPTIDSNPGAAGLQTRSTAHAQLTGASQVVNARPSIESTIAPAPGGNGVADLNGDGSTDRGVYRNGGWFVHNQGTVFHGLSGDIPVPADYNGNGTDDRAVYRDGGWYVYNYPTVFFGLPGDIPVPGNYDGDDAAVERAVYRGGAWYVEGEQTVFFGLPDDIPVPGDYNGDGDTERAVYRGGAWYVEGMDPVFFGLAGDIPVPADYNGDGDTERAVFRNGAWFIEGFPNAFFFGLAGDVPVPGDYNNDNFADVAVYRNGAWYVSGFDTVFYGLPGDIPLPLPQAIYREFF